jgi:hypothetical protein
VLGLCEYKHRRDPKVGTRATTLDFATVSGLRYDLSQETPVSRIPIIYPPEAGEPKGPTARAAKRGGKRRRALSHGEPDKLTP